MARDSKAVCWIGAAAAVAAGWTLWQRLREADLSGQTVLITGSSRGLGLLLAREFHQAGCRLVICARDGDELAAAKDNLESRGAEVLAAPCDVGQPEQVDRLVPQALERFGRIDVLVNNAGIIQAGPLESMGRSDFQQALDVMFWGVLNPTLAVLPGMLERRSGRIVNVTSIGGVFSPPHLLPYNCAKHAAVGLSEGLHSELRREGILVTTIVPGLMRIGSHLNAEFREPQEEEFTWFALGASLPVISMDAERAARQIVRATRRGEAFRILGLPAKLASRFHGLAPNLTSHLLAVVNQMLPTRNGGAGRGGARGIEVQERMRSGWLETLTTLGRRAAHKTQQFEATPSPSATP